MSFQPLKWNSGNIAWSVKASGAASEVNDYTNNQGAAANAW
jgi:hypothetical protein